MKAKRFQGLTEVLLIKDRRIMPRLGSVVQAFGTPAAWDEKTKTTRISL